MARRCANYYVSIPPIATDKTKPRGPNQAPQIRALGPNFHAVNEVNVTSPTSWRDWVAAGNGMLVRHRRRGTSADGFADGWRLRRWVSNFGQGTTFFDTYKANIKSWLGDPAFWADMSQYVRFFSQEVYGRIDTWAVPGATTQDRLAPTADFHVVTYDVGPTGSQSEL